RFISNDLLWAKDTDEKDADILRDMVSNNILYFDPTEAVYYPQGKSYQWGIKLYFESIEK
ncbi:MAG: family ATPase, partial [Acidobacteriota bacterium]|nr:family ATPase [Acidobacteriota bacterium]